MIRYAKTERWRDILEEMLVTLRRLLARKLTIVGVLQFSRYRRKEALSYIYPNQCQ